MTGWYLMHRGWMASADFRPEPFTEPQAFLWSIEQAAHKPHGQWFNGTLYSVDRGEFVTSLHQMMDAFRWSEKRVRGFTQRMVKAQKWAKRGAHAGAKAPTILTVCNYTLFQTPKKSEGEAEGEAKGERGAKQGRSEGEEQKEGINNGNEGERKEREAAPQSRALVPSLPYVEAIAAWSEAAAIYGWTPVNPSLGDKRRTRLKRTLEKEGLAGWCEAIGRARQSPLLAGPDPPAWFNFDFLIKHDNLLKVKDGNYDRTFSNASGAKQNSAWLDAHADLSGQGFYGTSGH